MRAHLPNLITASRGACGPLVLGVLLETGANKVAFTIFLLAILTDLVDGFVARLLGATSRFALFLDPLSDKLLTGCTWGALASIGYAPIWLAVCCIGRDVVVALAFLREVRATGVFPAARPWGQIAVAFEGTALCVLLYHGPWLDVHWPSVGTALGLVAFALSSADGLEYAFRRRSVGSHS